MEKEKLKDLYKTIYSVTVEMEKVIEKEDFKELGVLISKKNDLIKELNDIKPKVVLSEEEKTEFNSIIIPIKELENKNIQVMKKKQNVIKEQIMNTNKESKYLSSYKTGEGIPPQILDERE